MTGAGVGFWADVMLVAVARMAAERTRVRFMMLEVDIICYGAGVLLLVGAFNTKRRCRAYQILVLLFYSASESHKIGMRSLPISASADAPRGPWLVVASKQQRRFKFKTDSRAMIWYN
mmetsp:Transcript_1564/g.3041  ORF Transcript_1564/g.3041 Transcript_1564/m.3041 type:complete len:118 (-) Transcript_1564:201-554(-)